MALKAIVPGVSGNIEERELLEEDLCYIGCHGFLKKPWNLKLEGMVAKLMSEKDNQWLKNSHLNYTDDPATNPVYYKASS